MITTMGYTGMQHTLIYWYKGGDIQHVTKCYDTTEVKNALTLFIKEGTLYNSYDNVVIGDNYTAVDKEEARKVLIEITGEQLSMALDIGFEAKASSLLQELIKLEGLEGAQL